MSGSAKPYTVFYWIMENEKPYVHYKQTIYAYSLADARTAIEIECDYFMQIGSYKQYHIEKAVCGIVFDAKKDAANETEESGTENQDNTNKAGASVH